MSSLVCFILDANCHDDFFNNHEDMKPVHDWLDKGGKIAYSPTSKFQQEAKGTFRAYLLQWERAGRLKEIEPTEVETEQQGITGLKSDDPHIMRPGAGCQCQGVGVKG